MMAARIFLQVFASDADSGINGQIDYSIVSGNTNEAFILDSVRGILATNVLLDREITPSYKYANHICIYNIHMTVLDL